MVFTAHEDELTVAIELPYTAIAGGKDFQVSYLPSDMVVSTIVVDKTNGGPQQKELSKNTWDNERRYPVDFSLALPLVSYKEATVDVNNGNITAREVQKQKLVAMFDFSPWWLIDRNAGFETKKIAMQLLPVVMVGLPIAGEPYCTPSSPAVSASARPTSSSAPSSTGTQWPRSLRWPVTQTRQP